jgi:hypothetical protein
VLKEESREILGGIYFIRKEKRINNFLTAKL